MLWSHAGQHQRVLEASFLDAWASERAGQALVMDTHFACKWDPSDYASRMSAAMGNLPEMNVWIGIVDGQEMVDFSTRHIKQAATRLGLGMAWTAADPPEYLWCPARGLPDWVAHAAKLQGG